MSVVRSIESVWREAQRQTREISHVGSSFGRAMSAAQRRSLLILLYRAIL